MPGVIRFYDLSPKISILGMKAKDHYILPTSSFSYP